MVVLFTYIQRVRLNVVPSAKSRVVDRDLIQGVPVNQFSVEIQSEPARTKEREKLRDRTMDFQRQMAHQSPN